MAVTEVAQTAVFGTALAAGTNYGVSLPGGGPSADDLVLVVFTQVLRGSDPANVPTMTAVPYGYDDVGVFYGYSNDTVNFFFRYAAAGGETQFHFDISYANALDANVYFMYIGIFRGAAAASASGAAGTFPADALSAAHTAAVDDVALHYWYDLSGFLPGTWDTSGLAAENGTALAKLETSDNTTGALQVQSVQPVTYSSAGAKSGLGFAPTAYGSDITVMTFWAGSPTTPAHVNAYASPAYQRQPRKVRIQELPYFIHNNMIGSGIIDAGKGRDA